MSGIQDDLGPLSCDRPAPGLVVYQPRRGFRYAMDPFLLAAWSLEAGRPALVGDLGTGSGIMALLLARLGIRVRGWDVRPEWIALARRSARESGLQADFELADVRTLPASDLSLALLNPPYLPCGRGACSPDPWKAAARTELNGDLSQLVAAGACLARRLCIVLPMRRAREGLDALEQASLHPARRCDLDQALVLLEGRREPSRLCHEIATMNGPQGRSARVRSWYDALGARLA